MTHFIYFNKALLTLLLMFVVCLPTHVFGQNTEAFKRTISISESASAEAEADLALISVDVLIEGRDAEDLEEETYKRSTALVEVFKQYQLSEEDFQTVNNSLYDSRRDKQYLKSVQLGYELKFKKLGKLDDFRRDVIKAGASRFRIQSFENTEAEKYARLASEMALKKAMDNAAALAAVAKMKLGDPISISVNKQYIRPEVRGGNYMMADAMMVKENRSEEPAINRTKVAYQATVNVTFELYKK